MVMVCKEVASQSQEESWKVKKGTQLLGLYSGRNLHIVVTDNGEIFIYNIFTKKMTRQLINPDNQDAKFLEVSFKRWSGK